MSTHRRHSVIDELDKTRQEHPAPHPHLTSDNAPLSRVASKDVTDEILEQSEAVHIPKDDISNNNNSNNNNNNSNNNSNGNSNSATGADKSQKDKVIGLSTTATIPNATWQPLASKSSNQLPTSSVTTGQGYGAQDHHDKPSVLPEILPGFKDRMADIHHATLKSVSDVTSPSSSHGSSSDTGREGEVGGKWTGGTMFPAMMPSSGGGGHKNPFSSGSVSEQQHGQQKHAGSAEEEANRKIARSSILYESADLEESTSSLTDDDHHHHRSHSSTSNTTHDPIGGTSSTLVQGGQGGRRWSHELSPEKAGLVGSVLSVAGLVKDVVLDKIQQRPPSSSTMIAGAHQHHHHPLTADEKQVAAAAAFGGSEESGDQTILIDGLLHHHQNHEAERAAAAATAASTMAPESAGAGAEELLKAAPGAAKEHQKSTFHLAADPETKKSLLLNHPKTLGYHAAAGTKDQQSIGDLTLGTALGAQHQRSASGRDLSKTSR
ncbi:hypothetical protein BGZ47_008987 [Haplosporangium gracile]|nr:hypothetical protein BGZ47_008987 [Haplosporangium gracile]